MKKRTERPDLPARFFKVIVPSTDSLRRLRIPLPFTQKYGHELLDVVRLTNNTTGDVWCVGLKKVEDKIFLHDGWEKFVGDHFITYGYFLIFKYIGNSTFNVHIFDLSATEVHYPLNGNCNVGRTNLGSRDTISAKDEDRDDDDSVMGSKYKKPSSGIRSRPRKKTFDFAGKSPSFTVKLKATNLYPRNSIYIPIAFCEYMPSAREQVELLDSDGRKWPVSITRGKGKEKYLKGGWSQFARQKKLRVGDVCIFKLIDTKKHVLNISTFGKWQHEKSPPRLTSTSTSTGTKKKKKKKVESRAV